MKRDKRAAKARGHGRLPWPLTLAIGCATFSLSLGMEESDTLQQCDKEMESSLFLFVFFCF